MLRFAGDRSYRCSFRAKADSEKKLRVELYDGISFTSNSGGYLRRNIIGPPGSFFSQVALARDAGVDLVSWGAANCWTPPEMPVNWELMDNQFRQIIAVNPKVLLVPRVSANAPDWWLERNPGGRMVYDGDSVVNFSCISDRNYRTDVCAYFEKLSRHLLETFPDNFAGIHPAGQGTAEWYYLNMHRLPLSGYDQSTRIAFRQWLNSRGDQQAGTAEPPTADERRAHPYGYLFEVSALPTGAPTSGHLALSSLLKSRDIDIIAAPIAYIDRDWIGTAPSMTVAESVQRAGILWLNEDDSRTFLDPRQTAQEQQGSIVNLEQTRQIMRRNTAQAALRGFGTWWMDLPGQGWFNDARIWEEMSLLHPVDVAMLNRRKPFTPEIAAIMDEESMCHLPGGSGAFTRDLIRLGKAALGRSGAPYGQYLLDDVLIDRVPAKLQIFLSTWALSPSKRAILVSQRGPGITRVWCYAPGYIYPDRLDVAGISGVTGFEAKAVTLVTAEATPTEAGKKLGLTTKWGQKNAVSPLFSVKATPEETLATYSDGSPAVALRRSEKGIDVFVGVPQLTPELVRALARIAGVHLFTEGKASIWAAEGYLSLQAHEDGPLVINTGKKGAVVDALNGKALGEGPELTLMLKKGEVRVMKY